MFSSTFKYNKFKGGFEDWVEFDELFGMRPSKFKVIRIESVPKNEDVSTNDLEVVELDELAHRVMRRISGLATTKAKAHIDETIFDNPPLIKHRTDNVQLHESKG
jgi:hypothetical protein